MYVFKILHRTAYICHGAGFVIRGGRTCYIKYIARGAISRYYAAYRASQCGISGS